MIPKINAIGLNKGDKIKIPIKWLSISLLLNNIFISDNLKVLDDWALFVSGKKRIKTILINEKIAAAKKTPERLKAWPIIGPRRKDIKKEKPIPTPIKAIIIVLFFSELTSEINAIKVPAIAPIPCKLLPRIILVISVAVAAINDPIIKMMRPNIITFFLKNRLYFNFCEKLD